MDLFTLKAAIVRHVVFATAQIKKEREREKDFDVRSSSPIFHHQPMTADSIHADLFLSILFFFFSSLCWKQQIEKGPQGFFFFPVLQSHFVGYCVRM